MVSSSSRGWPFVVAVLSCVFSSGCYDLKKEDPGIALTPDAHGVVRVPELGIQGRWYAYGDQYDEPRRCLSLGRHAPESCSSVLSTTALPTFDFPNDGALCLTGVAARVVPCLAPTEVECVALDRDGVPGPDAVVKRDLKTDPASCACGSSTCIQGSELCYCPTNPALMVPCEGDDNSNIWGAGIGLDFSLKNPGGSVRDPLIDSGGRSTWNPEDYGITGVGFDFSLSYGSGDSAYDPNQNANLRVEFPIELPEDATLPSTRASGSTQWLGTASINNENNIAGPGDGYPDNPTPSEEHPEGSPFWDAPVSWPNVVSPVRQGHNIVHFSDVNPPPQDQILDGQYQWDETRLLGIQFHVPTRKQQADKFSFCISNLTFIRD